MHVEYSSSIDLQKIPRWHVYLSFMDSLLYPLSLFLNWLRTMRYWNAIKTDTILILINLTTLVTLSISCTLFK